MPASSDDEGLHPASGDPFWQESAYLAWYDATTGFGGNHRIGNEPNRDRANLWCGVYHRDGTRFRGNGDGLPLVRLEENGLCAGPQRLFHDGKKVRFLLEGDECRLELEIEDDPASRMETTAEAFAGSDGPTGAIFSTNFHVFCRVRGSVTLDGRAADIDAPGWRDHSRGVRHWDSFVSSRSFGGSFGDSMQFRYGSMVGTNGSFFRHGSLAQHGKPVELTGTDMLVKLDDDSLRCPSAEVCYHLADGGTVQVAIETIGGMLGVTGHRHGWESVGEVTMDGEPGGWGFLEVNINPRHGDAPPAFALADALTNGIVRAER